MVRSGRLGAVALGFALIGTAAGAATDPAAGSKPAAAVPVTANAATMRGDGTQQVSAEGAHDHGTLVNSNATLDHGQKLKSEGANDDHRLVGAQTNAAAQSASPHP
jgi:hypothetical protein